MDLNKWNKEIDLEGLKQDIASASKSRGPKREYEEVPDGKYEVKVERMEIKEAKSSGKPTLGVMFRILNGPRKNGCIFANFGLLTGFGVKKANDFLRSLDTGLDIHFDDFVQFNNLVLDVLEKTGESNLEYLLDYTHNDKGFGVYRIEEVYES